MSKLVSLVDLVREKENEDSYKKVIDIIIKEVKEKFTTYDFVFHEPVPKHEDLGYTLEFVIDTKEVHQQLVIEKVTGGLKQLEISNRFIEEVKAGSVIPLGGGGIEINTASSGTAEINSGEPTRVIIAFTTPELKEKFEKVREVREKQEKELEERERKKNEVIEQAYEELTHATKVLAEKHDNEYADIVQRVSENYNKIE